MLNQAICCNNLQTNSAELLSDYWQGLEDIEFEVDNLFVGGSGLYENGDEENVDDEENEAEQDDGEEDDAVHVYAGYDHAGCDDVNCDADPIILNGPGDIYSFDFANLTFDVLESLEFVDIEIAFEFYNWLGRLSGFLVRKAML